MRIPRRQGYCGRRNQCWRKMGKRGRYSTQHIPFQSSVDEEKAASSSCAAQCTSETSVMMHAANMKYRVNMTFAHIFPPTHYSCLNSLFGHARVLDLFVSLFVHDKSSTVHCGARLCKWCVISTQRHEFPTRRSKTEFGRVGKQGRKGRIG